MKRRQETVNDAKGKFKGLLLKNRLRKKAEGDAGERTMGSSGESLGEEGKKRGDDSRRQPGDRGGDRGGDNGQAKGGEGERGVDGRAWADTNGTNGGNAAADNTMDNTADNGTYVYYKVGLTTPDPPSPPPSSPPPRDLGQPDGPAWTSEEDRYLWEATQRFPSSVVDRKERWRLVAYSLSEQGPRRRGKKECHRRYEEEKGGD